MRGRNLLPDNKHLQKTELCVIEIIDIHVCYTKEDVSYTEEGGWGGQSNPV
jgi:hypothetical protein